MYKQTEIVKMLESDGLKISKQHLGRILKNPLYAGIIKDELLDETVKGDFKPLISEEDFYIVQSMLKGNNQIVKPRVRDNPDFPLRNFLICPNYKNHLTGGWTTGRNKKYPYYHCRTKGCKLESIPRDQVEKKFLEYLDMLKPSERLLKLFNCIIEDVWKEKQKGQKKIINRLESELSKLNDKKNRIIELVVSKTFNKETLQEEEDKIENKISLMKIQINELKLQCNDISALTNYYNYFIRNLSKIWLRADINQRIKLQNKIFPEGIFYKDGIIGTTKKATIYEVLGAENTDKSTLVAQRGLEPL